MIARLAILSSSVLLLSLSLWCTACDESSRGTQEVVYRNAQGEQTRALLDTSSTKVTSGARWRVTATSDVQPIPLRQMHAWTVQVLDVDGQPVRDATVAISGRMPEHAHGLPSVPRMTGSSAPGTYHVDGVKFQMPGWWVLDVTIDAGGSPQTATFNLVLP